MTTMTSNSSLTHLNEAGEAAMVDISGKASTARLAVAEAQVQLGAAAFQAVCDATVAKGDVLGTSRIAGIMAAKRCAELIPLCHSLPLSHVGVEFEFQPDRHVIIVLATCSTDYRTGVEMEAMTAASVAALTLYDMCKGMDKGIVIESVRLLRKTGGKSGEWRAASVVAAEGADKSASMTTISEEMGASSAFRHGGDAPAANAEPNAHAHVDVGASTSNTNHSVNAAPASTQALRLVYFARVAELVGCREETVSDWTPLSGLQLLERLEARYPALAPARRLNLAVNQQHVTLTHRIQAGDEVAVFEPVTGG